MLRTVFIGLILEFSLANSPAAILEFRPAADTTLHQTAPNNNMGAHTHVAIGETAQLNAARGLFRYDLSALPTNAIVTSVSITFTLPSINRLDPAGSVYSVHRVQRSWGEGSKTGLLGAVGTEGEATWLHSTSPTTWETAGGDFLPAASATQILGPSPGVYSVASTPGLIADVQSWLTNAAENFGWLLKVADESVRQTARQFASRETADGALLRVEYSFPEPQLRIVSIERSETNIIIRWTGGQGSVAVDRLAEVDGDWQEAAITAEGEFVDTLQRPMAFYRLRDE